jgi:DNA-binding GntR family transcriptional regulator
MVQIRDELLDGKIAPGTWLREEQMAERFEVGRYTVRSAIEQLISVGLLVHERNRGAFVSPISPDRVERLFEARKVIEVGSLQLLLGTGADLSEFKAHAKLLGSFDETTPWHTVIEVHNDFHRSIVATGGNIRLLDTYDRYQDDLQFMLSFLGRAHTVDAFAKNHTLLAEEICQGGPEAIELLEYDLTEFGVPPLLRALAELEGADTG